MYFIRMFNHGGNFGPFKTEAQAKKYLGKEWGRIVELIPPTCPDCDTMMTYGDCEGCSGDSNDV